MFKKILLMASIFSLFLNNVFAEKVNVFAFTKNEFDSLKKKKVKGETKWDLGSNENGNYIRAEAEGQGSGLGKELFIDL